MKFEQNNIIELKTINQSIIFVLRLFAGDAFFSHRQFFVFIAQMTMVNIATTDLMLFMFKYINKNI